MVKASSEAERQTDKCIVGTLLTGIELGVRMGPKCSAIRACARYPLFEEKI